MKKANVFLPLMALFLGVTGAFAFKTAPNS
jgi:hypothetical protein